MYDLIFYLWKEIAPRVGRRGQGRKNAADVGLAWHFYACCEPRVASSSAGDSDGWRDSNRNGQQWKYKEELDAVEDAFTCLKGQISPIYPSFTFVLEDAILAQRGKGKQCFAPVLLGWKKTCTVRPGRWQLRCVSVFLTSGSSQCRDREWNMEGGKSLKLNVSLWGCVNSRTSSSKTHAWLLDRSTCSNRV